eukprot:TRINITY_DN8048_c0_g1_i1.p1 TRINITY_DN8048_c0_g1~~TRINITY_DN8048_c0_g1_i1.p1  ORF type:complete len:684 (+),score=120.95 TRINITY_DN8048_c0_g1_i1:1649-3700(+)
MNNVSLGQQADRLANQALSTLQDTFPANWKSLSQARLITEVRKVVDVANDPKAEISARKCALQVLDNLAWHSKTKTKILTNPNTNFLATLCTLSFGQPIQRSKTFKKDTVQLLVPLEEPEMALRLLALNTLNKAALSNGNFLIQAGILRYLTQMASECTYLPLSAGAPPADERQQILLRLVNIFLTFSNRKEFLNQLVLGSKNHKKKIPVAVIDLVLDALRNGENSTALRGSAVMTLLKLCEHCRDINDECTIAIKKKALDTNIVKDLMLLLLNYAHQQKQQTPSSKEEEAESTNQKYLFTNQSLILQVFYALSNLDSFEKEALVGELGEKIIRQGGAVMTVKLLNDNTADSKDGPNIEFIRAAVRLLSNLAFVKANQIPLLSAGAFRALIRGILASSKDAETISFGSRAVYVLKKRSDDSSNAKLPQPEADALADMLKTIREQADSLLMYLIDVVFAVKPNTVKYPSNEAFMLRHLCLLLFLFSSDAEIMKVILAKPVDDPRNIVEALYLMMNQTVDDIKINAVAVVANFVETDAGAKRIGAHDKLVLLLDRVVHGTKKDRKNRKKGKKVVSSACDALVENASYALKGLAQKAPESLERLGVVMLAQSAEESQNENDESTATPAGTPSLRSCGFCNSAETRPGEFPVCSRCKQVCYCSREHQRYHWKTHKPECGKSFSIRQF